MTGLAIQDVLESTGARLLRGDRRREIVGVSTDTRTLAVGELFFALSGPNFDGNRFARQAVDNGAGGLLLRGGAEAEEIARGLDGDTPVVAADDPLAALADLARWHRARLDAPVIGITGSSGKTTTKDALAALLGERMRVTASPASFNNAVGVPRTVLLADARTEALVVEIGTNAPGEVEALASVARPTVGVVTNVGHSHLSGLGSLAGVAREKGALPASLPPDGLCVLSADCPFTPELRARTDARVVTFGRDASSDLRLGDVWFHDDGTSFRLDGPLADGAHEVTVPLLGAHAALNVAAALAAARGLGHSIPSLVGGLARLVPARRRLERVEVGGVTLLDDSYNANPDSVRAGLAVLVGLHRGGRRVLVLGDMRELGPSARDLHRDVGVAAAAAVDLLVTVGAAAGDAAEAARRAAGPALQVEAFDDVDAALEGVPELLVQGDVVLLKASRSVGLERVAEALVRARAEGV